jgi:GntR family transcriptional regulator, transcriptional repressor for pyruvate dehydrogenase complex
VPAEAAKPTQSVYASLRDDIREFIRNGQLQPGDRLPSERTLAAQLGVSRTSLRQALTALRVEGLVDVRHGQGVHLIRSIDDIVPPITADSFEASTRVAAAGEVRNALEALAAKLAAQRRDADDLEGIVAGIREMDTEIKAGKSGLNGDRAFHAAILAAARNDVLAELLRAVGEHSVQIAEASLDRPGQPSRSLAAHRLIFEAISARDAEEARQLMDEHLEITGRIGDQTAKAHVVD